MYSWTQILISYRMRILCFCTYELVAFFFVIKPTRCTNFTNFLSWNSTCFGQILCPSSGVYSLSNGVWHIPLLSVQWVNSWWWTDELSETCTVSWQNIFVKLVHLIGFIIKKFFTMHGHMNVKNLLLWVVNFKIRAKFSYLLFQYFWMCTHTLSAFVRKSILTTVNYFYLLFEGKIHAVFITNETVNTCNGLATQQW
jgi:hypothetical protein